MTLFYQGIEEFNQEQFYACHDTLEEIWMESVEPDKQFLQGILQIAVACYHLNNENWQGTVTLLGEGLRRLRNYLPDYGGINTDRFFDESVELLERVQQTPPDAIAPLVEQFKTGKAQYPKIVKIVNEN